MPVHETASRIASLSLGEKAAKANDTTGTAAAADAAAEAGIAKAAAALDSGAAGAAAAEGKGAAATKPPPSAAAKAQQAKAAFGELLPMVSPAQLVACDDPEAEAEHWAVFADVYEAEVAARTAGASGGKADGGKGGGGNGAQQQQQQLSVDARRQILADILVWAEVSQARYDEAAAAFVTAPHESDDAFNRIGRALREARQARGLEPAR